MVARGEIEPSGFSAGYPNQAKLLIVLRKIGITMSNIPERPGAAKPPIAWQSAG
jgi:hypothetical protein